MRPTLQRIAYVLLGWVLAFSLPAQAATLRFTNEFDLPDNTRTRGAVVDVTGDSVPELVTLAGVYSVLTNRTFTNLFLFDRAANVFTTGDVNQDGALDVLRDEQIWYGTGTGTFALVTNYPSITSQPWPLWKIAAGDMNGDGRLDACYAFGSFADVWTNHGGLLVFSRRFTITNQTLGEIAVADFNGDHVSDLALVLGSGPTQVRFHFGTASGEFTEPLITNVSGGYDYPSIATGDFNADGFADVAIGGEYRTNVAVLCGTNTGVLSATYAMASMPMRLRVADWDGDGYDDILTQTWTRARMFFLRGHGDGTFAPGSLLNFSTNEFDQNLSIGAVMDFDRDGRMDLIGTWVNGPSVWRNVTTGATNPPVLSISRTADGSVVNWQRTGFGFFRVQSATNVGENVSWNDVGEITKRGNRSYLTNSGAHPMRVYRLR